MQFDVACQAADALAHLHAHTMLHRDVSPANLMRARSGTIKLADFGRTRICSDSLRITNTKSLVGSSEYMAPEQAMQGQITDKADVWALAATLLEAWSGERPYSKRSMHRLMVQQAMDVPPSLDIAARPLPAALRELLAQCLQVAPDEWPSAAALYQRMLLVRTSLECGVPVPEAQHACAPLPAAPAAAQAAGPHSAPADAPHQQPSPTPMPATTQAPATPPAGPPASASQSVATPAQLPALPANGHVIPAVQVRMTCNQYGLCSERRHFTGASLTQAAAA